MQYAQIKSARRVRSPLQREKRRLAARARYALNKDNVQEQERRRAKDKRWRDANPDKVRARNQRWSERTPGGASEAAKAWRQANPDAHLLRRYEMLLSEWNELFAAQGSACAACKTADPGKQPWHTDHDHQTGRVRGILCFRCNIALGLLGDDLESVTRMMQALVSYLSASTDD